MAEQAGLIEDEIQRVQRFEYKDEKRAATLRSDRDVVDNRGHPSDESFNAAREADYTDEQIIEIVATVAFATYSNYLNDTMQTEMDIPVREPLGSR